MSEKHKIINSPEQIERLINSLEENKTKSPEHEEIVKNAEIEHHKKLENARLNVEQQSNDDNETLEALESVHRSAEKDYIMHPPNKAELKHAQDVELKHIRSKLSKTDKALSKVVHQPTVRNVSEVGSWSLFRPSGLLGGGITAFVGITLYYYFSKNIGLKYNYLIFIMLFVVGFIIGLLIEMTVKVARFKNR